MIFIDPKSAILHENLCLRILELVFSFLFLIKILITSLLRGKREPCEITFDDFDDVSYKIVCQPETPEVVKVNMLIKGAADLKK
jgi:hypothetical protein